MFSFAAPQDERTEAAPRLQALRHDAPGHTGAGRRALTVLGGLALAGVVVWWAWRALRDPLTFDFKLYYRGGLVAWATGQPDHFRTWDGTPLLASIMAIVSQLFSLATAAKLITVLNTALVVAVAVVVLRRLRPRLPSFAWWLAAVLLLSFAPTVESVWWKQFNIVALTLALAGFELLRRGRTGAAAGLLGLSVSIKPLAFLLPLVLLARRETRRAGALALVWVAGLNLAALAMLAARGHDLGLLNPASAVHNFLNKTGSTHNGWACSVVNLAPGSLLCRSFGHHGLPLQHVIAWAGVGLLGLAVILALRGYRARSWEVFAFTCPLAVMLSPLEWSHYQILLAPLFVLLLVRFTGHGASGAEWSGLAVAFVLSSLMWLPYGTLPGAVNWLTSAHGGTRLLHDEPSIAPVAQWGQYLLVLTGLLWYGRRRRAPDEAVREMRRWPPAGRPRVTAELEPRG